MPQPSAVARMRSWASAMSGILSKLSQLLSFQSLGVWDESVGAVQTKIDIPYCDCGFKDQEIVSQVWAEMIVDGAVLWLINGASILAALGAVLAGRLFGGREMPAAWATASYLVGILVALAVVLGLVAQGDASDWLSIALTALVIPGWALWIATRFDRADGNTGGRTGAVA